MRKRSFPDFCLSWSVSTMEILMTTTTTERRMGKMRRWWWCWYMSLPPWACYKPWQNAWKYIGFWWFSSLVSVRLGKIGIIRRWGCKWRQKVLRQRVLRNAWLCLPHKGYCNWCFSIIEHPWRRVGPRSFFLGYYLGEESIILLYSEGLLN